LKRKEKNNKQRNNDRRQGSQVKKERKEIEKKGKGTQPKRRSSNPSSANLPSHNTPWTPEEHQLFLEALVLSPTVNSFCLSVSPFFCRAFMDVEIGSQLAGTSKREILFK
jgi:hypothetical protein